MTLVVGFFFFGRVGGSEAGRVACTITRLRAGAGMQRIKQNVNPFSAVI